MYDYRLNNAQGGGDNLFQFSSVSRQKKGLIRTIAKKGSETRLTAKPNHQI
jgi:hypothetical protein